MGSLVLQLEDGFTHDALGRAVIDVRYFDADHPVVGTFPVLRPRGVPQTHGSPTTAGAAAAAGMGSMGTHAGSLEVRLDMAFHTRGAASASSSLDVSTTLSPWAVEGTALHGWLPQPHAVFLPHAPPGEMPPGHAHPAVGAHDPDARESNFDAALAQLDLFELLLDRLHRCGYTLWRAGDGWHVCWGGRGRLGALCSNSMTSTGDHRMHAFGIYAAVPTCRPQATSFPAASVPLPPWQRLGSAADAKFQHQSMRHFI
eukprot:362433-Chlamydomonas_euryale.AAC.1